MDTQEIINALKDILHVLQCYVSSDNAVYVKLDRLIKELEYLLQAEWETW